MKQRTSDVGVLDKMVQLLESLGTLSNGRKTLAELSAETGIHRATAHRLLKALEVHEFVQVEDRARWSLGPTIARLGRVAEQDNPLRAHAATAMQHLCADTEESVQLYVRVGEERVCIASFQSPHGLRTIVEVGAVLPLAVGSAGKVLRAQSAELLGELLGEHPWEYQYAESVGEREAGVASVSAPIRDGNGSIVAAISVSGPIERLSRSPGDRFGARVAEAATAIELAAGYRDGPAA